LILQQLNCETLKSRDIKVASTPSKSTRILLSVKQGAIVALKAQSLQLVMECYDSEFDHKGRPTMK